MMIAMAMFFLTILAGQFALFEVDERRRRSRSETAGGIGDGFAGGLGWWWNWRVC